MQSGRSLLDYFAELDSLWSQLTTLQPLTTKINELTDQRNMLRIVKFLSSLDSAYTTKKNVFSDDYLVTVTKYRH